MKLIRRLMEEYGMTDRVAKVASAYAEGMANGDIARSLGITPGSVSGRFSIAKRALECRTREEMVAKLNELDQRP